MKIKEIYAQKKEQKQPVISLEIFPPKKEDGIASLYQTIEELGAIKPDFISVTYGAGGSENGVNKTLELASEIKHKYGVESLHHLTCVLNNKEQISTILSEIKENGVENILALRGDVPIGVSELPNAYHYAKDLIQDVQEIGGFSVGAACYPEGHIDQLNSRENITHLREKEEAGADFFISQLFFENSSFYRLLDDARSARVNAPIAAGIMPIMSRVQVEKMIFLCGASLPTKLIKLIHKYEHNIEDLRKAGLEYALAQVDDLIAHGVDGVHLYTMNRPVVAKTTLMRYRK
ncbi:MAG: methylenetetrahydrofolate reductase [Lactobacillales bacterium]|jgi:methylenetetrahydrofolate reductase (NADPH)|nr:methylenetetrahydrofolate reductase [Lactobacillales bacterium]